MEGFPLAFVAKNAPMLKLLIEVNLECIAINEKAPDFVDSNAANGVS